MSEENYDYVIHAPAPIIDGYVTITVGQGPNAIRVKQKVKQVKGRGTHDADLLLAPSDEHIEYINWMLTKMKNHEHFSSYSIFEQINHARKLQSLAKNIPYHGIMQSTHIRIISELLRKAVIYIAEMEGKKPLYGLVDVEYADRIIEWRKF